MLFPRHQTCRFSSCPLLWDHEACKDVARVCCILAPTACAAQGHARLCDPGNYAEIESGLTWLGVAGLQDPPRGEVRGAIRQCAQAGVRVRIAGIICQTAGTLQTLVLQNICEGRLLIVHTMRVCMLVLACCGHLGKQSP